MRCFYPQFVIVKDEHNAYDAYIMKKLFFVAFVFFLTLPFGRAEAATFYADFSTTTCNGAGTASTTSYCSLDDFAEVARAEGDQVFVRRGTSTTTGLTGLNPLSDGTITNPIIISADYDNIWSDFSTSTQTYTLAVGSSTMTASANITGIAAGDWIYVAGDQFESPNAPTVVDKIYSYEVRSVIGTQLTLYFPYNGKQTGAGNSLRVMPDNPIRGVTSGTGIFSFNADGGWMVKGMDIRGSDNNFGLINIDGGGGLDFSDLILKGDGASIDGVSVQDGASGNAIISKSRAFDVINVFNVVNLNNGSYITINSFFADCNNRASSRVVNATPTTESINIFKINELVAQKCISGFDLGDGNAGSIETTVQLYSRNSKFLGLASTSQVLFTGNNAGFHEAYIEDANGYIGENFFTSSLFSTTSEQMTIQKTSVVRNASTYSSLLVRSSPYFSNIRQASMLKLFEYPIYTDTTSKTYSVFFSSTSTADWTANPTASEMWIECEYWAHPLTNGTTTRAVKRSTGTLDFTGSTAWQSLAVTCQPTATGILYLRGFYGKPQESGESNWFYMDSTPVIS